LIVVVNPHTRLGRSAWLLPTLSRSLPALQALVVPASRQALVDRAAAAVRDGEKALMVVGGDGTLNAAMQALAGSQVALAIAPAGTANDLARGLGYPRRVDATCRLLRAATPRAIDLIEVEGRVFATGGGLGSIAEVARLANGLKASPSPLVRACGSSLYTLLGVLYLLFTRHLGWEAELVVDGLSRGRVTFDALFVMNQPVVGRRVRACPAAANDDGVFDVCLVHHAGRFRTILTLLAMTWGGRHVGLSHVEVFQARALELRADAPLAFTGDGEWLAEGCHLAFTLRPGALRVLAPAPS
jgi:diacylglycerol kinase family enzyme